jgi:hypothetical protein
MSIRFKLLMAFGVLCILSAGAALYSIRQVTALSTLTVQLYDGPLMAVSYARSAQVNFTQARFAVEEAISMRENPTAERIGAIEKSMQQFKSDMAVVQERMGDQSGATINRPRPACASFRSRKSSSPRAAPSAPPSRAWSRAHRPMASVSGPMPTPRLNR